VSIGAPVGHGMRRQDMLAMLRWTLPALRRIAPLPDRIAVVGATDPMWRGGLSGPRSAYLHTSLPLISEDGTSPLLHEMVHVWMGARAGPDGDWIVEGLAELYSLEALVRSRTISKRRYERALARIEARGRSVRSVVATERASGAVTARAVGLLRDLDGEIRAATDDARGLDDVMRELASAPQTLSLARFRALCEQVAGTHLPDFFARRELSRAP
jgi:predicted metalloprotease with PDZ domain